jgi:hypothetical protein
VIYFKFFSAGALQAFGVLMRAICATVDANMLIVAIISVFEKLTKVNKS